ncbi:MAG: hypothetical protein AAFP26_05110 [Planctomycetota bacterium]
MIRVRGCAPLIAGAGLFCGACAKEHGRTTYLPGVEPRASLIDDTDEPRSLALTPLLSEEPARGYAVLASVEAWADTQIGRTVEGATDLAARRLRARASEAGADAVLLTSQRVIELAGGSASSDPVFTIGDEASRDRLRPGGGGPVERTRYRVRLSGRAIVFDAE